MDYKYIEQLLERYWAAETSLEEESTLKDFFAQSNVPAHLARYKALFDYEQAQTDVTLGESFDERLCALVAEAESPKQPRRATILRQLRPWLGAAASVAILCFIGLTAHSLIQKNKVPVGWDYNSATYTDTYENPEVAYDESIEALKFIQEGLKTAVADSIGLRSDYSYSQETEE